MKPRKSLAGRILNQWPYNILFQFFSAIFPIILINSEVVGGSIEIGEGKSVASIKEGLHQAKSFDTLLVYPGVYREQNLIIQKPIHIIGINQPILDGEFQFEIITISGSDIQVEGLTIQNSGHSGMNEVPGIKCIDSRRVRIINNRLLNNHFGIHVSNSKDILIQNNFIQGKPTEEQNTGNGIHLWKCEHAKILSNEVSGHRDGIYFEFVTESVIQDNISTRNIRYGLHFMFSHNNLYLCNEFLNNGAGVAVMYSKHVHMEENYFSKNWGPSAYGILLKDISDSYIFKNKFLENTVGIHLEGTSRMKIFSNEFIGNGWAMKVQASCTENVFEHNNFYSNSFDVATNGSISLNEFRYNYWDKYEGYDLNKDGIGDISYHPVSLYSLVVEQNPTTILLLRSILIGFLDKAEKAIPSLTPENLKDQFPIMYKNTI